MVDRDKLLKQGLEDRILPTTEEPSLHKKRLIQGGLGIQLGFFFFFFLDAILDSIYSLETDSYSNNVKA